MEIINSEEKTYRDGEWGIKCLFRGPRIDWGVFRFRSGDQLGVHYHNQVEETFLFNNGHGEMTVDDRKIEISPGISVRVEPGEKHNFINTGSDPLEGVFIKTPYLPEDKNPC